MNNLNLTVSELNEYVRRTLASDPIIQNLNITGEISNFKSHFSGHWYFTLKDENASISCVMFRTYSENLDFFPTDGMLVKLKGSVSLYTKTGQYQFYVSNIEKSGIGDLYQKYDELKKKLQNEGLFDQSIKKDIPFYPRMVGIITSSSGAVVHDILQVANRRNSNIPFCLYPVSVQGEGAAEQMIKAIKYFNNIDEVDVLILARGGGSFEDLFEFNNELLAREIHSSKIPIISAIGHETDFTIADFVSDRRAATPSEAAEIAVRERSLIYTTINNIKQHIKKEILNYFDKQAYIVNDYKLRLDLLKPELYFLEIQNKIKFKKIIINKIVNDYLDNVFNKINKYKEKIEILNPNYILKKGFSYMKVNKKYVKSTNDINKNDVLQIYLQDGKVYANVIDDREEQ